MTVLRILLWFLPGAFRREFGGQLLETARDQSRDATGPLGFWSRFHFWRRQWWSVVKVGGHLWRRRGVSRGPNAEALHQERRRHRVWDGLARDVAHSIRALRARPGFTSVAILTLALGVGATTAMFSAVNSVLLRALPYEGAKDVVVLKQTDVRDGTLQDGVSASNMRDLADMAQTLSHASVADGIHGLRLVEEGKAVSLRTWVVAEGFFEAIGGRPHLGRTFLPEEFVAGRERVVLLSHSTWQTRFGGDANIIGRQLVLDGAEHTVVGVMPADFKYPSASETWTPRPPQPWDDGARSRAGMVGVARLAPGATAAQAQTEIDRLASDLARAYPAANANMGLRVIPLREHLFGTIRSPLILLLGAVGLVLLVASANVAGLQLARGAARSREYVLRGALGASSRRILGLVALESLVLAAVGGLLGIGLAYLGVAAIRLLGPEHLPRIEELRIDGTVLLFALLATLGSAVVAGIAPALRASRLDLTVALSEGSRGSTGGRGSTGLRDRLVVAEIALALVLTIGAGLLVRSFDRLLDKELGFEPEGRLAFQVWAYDDDHRSKVEFFERSLEEIRTIPGVDAVGLTSDLPLADDRSILSIGRTSSFTIEGRPLSDPRAETIARYVAIDDGYAEAMGVAVRAGRSFSTQDHAESPPVVMVSEAFARRHLAGEDPLSQRITLERDESSSREIVGVLADVRRQGLESEPQPEIYAPLSQEPSNGLTFVVKTKVDPETLIPAVREATWAADPSQAIWAIRPVTSLLSDWIRQRRFNTTVLVVFAGLALTLAGIGVYGLMSFSVAQRVNEMGIRRALGGRTGDIMKVVLRRAVVLSSAGVGLGFVGSVVLTRLLRGMLYDIEPFDPFTFLTLSVFMVGVAVLAAFLPARRATRVDPMTALRTE